MSAMRPWVRFSLSMLAGLLVTLIVGATAVVRAETVSVNIGDNFFEPATITVNVGDTVTWTHNGQRPHDVTATGGAFSSPRRMANGQQFTYTATTPGTYEYICTIHVNGGMRGTLVVRAAGAGQPGMPRTGAGGLAADIDQPWWLLAGGLLTATALAAWRARRRRADAH